MRKRGVWIKLVGVMALGVLLGGCGLSFTIKEPALSDVTYKTTDMPSVTLNVIDKRAELDAVHLIGKIGVGAKMKDISNLLTFKNIEDPIGFFAMNLEKELNQRGVPVKCNVVDHDQDGINLHVQRYQIVNYRATGFSPWEACHVFAGVIRKNDEETPIKAYFYNGKVPVWSMKEIVEPCFDIPTSILIKDVASKINMAVFNLQTPDEKVQSLTDEIDAEIGKEDPGPFDKVLELGYSNNPMAVTPLVKYTQASDEFFQSCAVSAIGMLKPEDQLEFLKNLYKNAIFNKKYMAAKAIGDIGTDDALAFIRDMKTEEAYEDEGGLASCVDLYAPE